MKASEEAHKLFPYLMPSIEKMVRGLVAGGGSSGTPGVGGAPSPHALNSAHHTGTLANAQAPQFLLMDGTRDLTGNLAVDPGITIDGVDLSAHAADPDAHHDRATVGDGLEITGQHISVDLATNSKLKFTSGDLAVDQAADFLWTGIHQFDQDIQLNANLSFIGGDRAIVASNDLFFDVGGDILLMADNRIGTDNYTSQLTGWRVDYAGAADFRYIYTDELHAKAFIADLEQALAGLQIITKSVAELAQDFTAPAAGGVTTIVVRDLPSANNMQVFQSGDIIRVREFSRSAGSLNITNCWGVVTSYVDGPGDGEQTWTFTRSTGSNAGAMTAGTVIEQDAIILDYGVSGNGYYEVNAIDGIYAANSPYAQVVTWTGHPATGSSLRMRLGNLAGVTDAVVNPSGYGLYSDNAYLKGIVSAANDVIRLDEDGIRIKGQPAAYDELYSYEFQNTAGQELGGLYLRYTDSTTDLAEIDLLAVGTAGIRPKIGIQAFSDQAGVPGSPFIDIRAVNSDTGVQTSITMDVSPTVGTIVIGASDFVSVTAQLKTVEHLPAADDAYNLGSASFRWSTVYADQLIITGSISGGILSGAEWEYPGSMVIDANNASNTTVSIANQGTGRADLDVDRNITLGGTIDGVDLAAHVLSANAHHDAATAGSGISLSGQIVSVDGTVVRTSRSLTAGAGLTGGGDLSANRSFAISLAALSGLNLTSGLAVDDSIAGDGLSIASKVMAVNSTVVRTTRTLTAGDGLSGGGDLSANRSFAVDSTVVRTSRTLTAGSGLTGGGDLSANRSFAISLAGTSGLNLTSGLAIDDSIAGAGLAISGKVLAVGAANTSITVNANDINVNSAHAFTWTNTHQFNSDVQLNADLDFLGLRSITTNSTNNLTIAPGGDLVLNPTGEDVLPGGSSLIDLGDYNRKWRTFFASELYVETLVAQDVMATIGGRVLVAPTTTLIADMTNVQTTIDVKHNNLVNGSYIRLQTAPGGVAQIEVMKITSGASVITGGYRYNVTRNLDASGANSWVNGDAVVDLGSAAGAGYIDLTSTSTLHSHLGPTITIYSRTGTTNWDDTKPVVTMGNLDSFVDYPSTEFGFAVGNDLTLGLTNGFSGLTADRTNGLRLYNTALQWLKPSGTTYTLGINATDGTVEFKENAVNLLKMGASQAIFSGQVFANNGLQVVGTMYPGSGGLDFGLGVGMTAVIKGDATDGVTIEDGGISHSVHPNGYRWRQYATNGYYVSTTRVNIIAFTLANFASVTVRLSYNQFNTGTASAEPYIGLGACTITADSSAIVVNSSGLVNANHASIAFETSGKRVLIYVTRSTGTSFRSDDNLRNVTVDVMGNVSSIEVSPDAI